MCHCVNVTLTFTYSSILWIVVSIAIPPPFPEAVMNTVDRPTDRQDNHAEEQMADRWIDR